MEIKVCIGSSCHLKGSREIVETFKKIIQEGNLHDKVELSGTFCMAKCQEGVCVSVDGKVHSVTPSTAETFLKDICNL